LSGEVATRTQRVFRFGESIPRGCGEQSGSGALVYEIVEGEGVGFVEIGRDAGTNETPVGVVPELGGLRIGGEGIAGMIEKAIFDGADADPGMGAGEEGILGNTARKPLRIYGVWIVESRRILLHQGGLEGDFLVEAIGGLSGGFLLVFIGCTGLMLYHDEGGEAEHHQDGQDVQSPAHGFPFLPGIACDGDPLLSSTGSGGVLPSPLPADQFRAARVVNGRGWGA